MQTVTCSRQGLAIAWRAAKAYSVDGARSRALRVWRWPGYFLVMTLMGALAAGDTVWEGTAAISVPCRSRRRARALPGLTVFVLLLAVVSGIACVGLATSVLSALGGHRVSSSGEQVLAGCVGFVVLFAPVIGAQLRPGWVRESCAVRQWRRRLERDGRTVVAAAWPMRGGAFSVLLPAVVQEARQAGQVVLVHARSATIADIYRRKGARTHPRCPTVLAWF